jgi:PAS domain S-box-containing protein
MSAASPDRPPGRAAAGALAAGQPATSPSQDSIARLGLRGVIALLEQSPDGVVVCRADDRCYVYANPVACRLMGYRFEELLGRDLLMNFPEREHPAVLARFPGQPGQWTGVLALPDGTERQVTWSSTLFSAGGARYAAAIFRDTTELRGAAAHAASLAQAAAAAAAGADLQQMLRTLAQAGLDATSATAVALDLVDAEDKVIRSGGRAGMPPGYAAAITACSAAGARVPDIEQLYAGRPIVFPDGRQLLAQDPKFDPLLKALEPLDWQACMYVFMTYRGTVLGDVAAYFPAGISGPTEAEMSFLTGLADHAAVAVANTRLLDQAQRAAALEERARLARDLHDSVSQALFSMTLHARAAQKALDRSPAARTDPALAKAADDIAALRELTSAALAEMRALIFEVRPDALAEAGLVTALTRQAAALTARSGLTVAVTGPGERLPVPAPAEEQAYRVAMEALHNAVKHSGARQASITIANLGDTVEVAIADNGAGFDPTAIGPGHLGLRTMRERAAQIGATLDLNARPGSGTTVRLRIPCDQSPGSCDG